MKNRLWILGLVLVLMFSSCQGGQDSMTGAASESTVPLQSDGAGESTSQNQDGTQNQDGGSEDAASAGRLQLSNMGDSASIEEVRSALKKVLSAQSVEEFIHTVQDYNEAVEYAGLIGAFEERGPIEYDVLKMSELWTAKKGDFIGTNCRLNSFLLLRRDIEVQSGDIDDTSLVFDNNAIEAGKVLDGQDVQSFRFVFSRVKTENTKDIRIHAKKMEAHFQNIVFNENARMISVVLHDNLDGDFLFVGHVGVLVEDKDKKNDGKYLFVEKLAFDQPYQAIKFDTKEDCYAYLYRTYKHHCDPTSAKPFIMDNGQFVELDLYDEE